MCGHLFQSTFLFRSSDTGLRIRCISQEGSAGAPDADAPMLLPSEFCTQAQNHNKRPRSDILVDSLSGLPLKDVDETFLASLPRIRPLDAEGRPLQGGVDSLPKLLERKKKLESHTNILSATMRAIAARDLPVFFEAETSDMLKSDKAKLEGLLGASKGTLNDKLRLLAVLTLRSSPDDAPLLAELEAALAAGYEGSGYPEEAAELAAGLEGIKHMRQMQTFQAASAPRQV